MPAALSVTALAFALAAAVATQLRSTIRQSRFDTKSAVGVS